MKLTKSYIDKVTYKGGWDIRWDSQIQGLGLRLFPSGKKSFVLSYRSNGRKRLFSIGQYGKITLDHARDLAVKHLADIADGGDPAEDKKKLAQGQKFGEFADYYIENHAKKHKKTWKEDERRIEKYLKPEWSAHLMTAITKSDVTRLHKKIGSKTPYEANRVLELISKIFELAIDWGVLEETVANPARRIQAYKEVKRDRWVSPNELKELAKAIKTESNIYVRHLIWMFLFTGARKTELLRAKWEHVDWKRKELRIPENKSDRVHYVPLSKEAISLLKKTPKEKGNPYIFVGNVKGQHIVNISKPWLRIRKAAKLHDLRIHDLRRTVGSWLAQDGNSLHLIGKVLNHADNDTTAIYARFGEDNVRDALANHGKKLDKFLSN